MTGPYDDIIHLPHHVSQKHPQMSRINRAAQFAPFSALSGYEAAVKETARRTDERIVVNEDGIATLDLKLRMLADIMADRPEITITYFQADERKSGGAYLTVTGAAKKIDEYERVIALMSGEKIAIVDILDIECAQFQPLW